MKQSVMETTEQSTQWMYEMYSVPLSALYVQQSLTVL